MSDPRADSLVFVRRSARKDDRLATRQRLGALLGERTETADGRAATRGERALLRLPAESAQHVVLALESRGIPARVLAIGRAWTSMPSHFMLMVFAVCVTGAMAGTLLTPLLWFTPLFGTALLVAAQRSASNPLLRSPAHQQLPLATETALRNAFAQAQGKPRALLGDLVRIVRPLVETLNREGDPAHIARSLAELLVAASATALEVTRLNTTHQTVQDLLSSGAAAESAEDLRTATHRCADAANKGIKRMVEAVRAVADISGSTALDAATGSRLSQLTHELTVDAQLREEALRSVDALLAVTSPNSHAD